jgi:hypothetical protein
LKPVIPESPPSSVDKGKIVIDGEVPVIPQRLAKLPIRRKPPTCHHCGEPRHIRPKSHIGKLRGRKSGRLLKTPMCHQCGVSRPRCPPPKPPRHHGSPRRNYVPRHQQLQKPTQAKRTWVPKKLYMEKQKIAEREIFYEGTSSVSSFMQDLVRYLTLQLKKEGRT